MEEELNSPRLERKIYELENEVKPYVSKLEINNKVLELGDSRKNIEYLSIPIVILGLLVVFRPYFIMSEIEDEDGTIHYKVDIKKVIMYWTAGSLICAIGLYGYRYKKQ